MRKNNSARIPQASVWTSNVSEKRSHLSITRAGLPARWADESIRRCTAVQRQTTSPTQILDEGSPTAAYGSTGPVIRGTPALRNLPVRSRSPGPDLALIEALHDVPESILIPTRTFFVTFSGQQSPQFLNPRSSANPETRPFRRRTNYIWSQFQRGLTQLEQYNTQPAFESFQAGCSLAEDFLSCPPKRFLVSLLMVMGNRRWCRHADLRRSILRFLSSMSSKVLGKRHPLSHIIRHTESWDLMALVARPVLSVLLDLQ